ncbi:hypothetical protein ACQVQK_02965 [Bacillus cereus]
MFGSAQAGWLIGMGAGFLGMALTDVLGNNITGSLSSINKAIGT